MFKKLLMLFALLALSLGVSAGQTAKRHEPEVESATEAITYALYAFEWAFLFLILFTANQPIMRHVSAHQAPPQFNKLLYALFHFVFYTVIGLGIFYLYYSTALHWYHAGESVVDIDNAHLPQVYASKGWFVAIWVLVMVSLALFKMAEIYWAEINANGEKHHEPRYLYWFSVSFALATHALVTIFLYLHHLWISAALYSGAAVLYVIVMIIYFAAFYDQKAKYDYLGDQNPYEKLVNNLDRKFIAAHIAKQQ
jgi:hypothetical protein